MSYEDSFDGRRSAARYVDNSPRLRPRDYSPGYPGSRRRSQHIYEDMPRNKRRFSRESDVMRKANYSYEPSPGNVDERHYSRDRNRSSPRSSRDMDRNRPDFRRNRSNGVGDSVPPKPSRILGVFGLSGRTEERHLYEIMSEYGNIEDIQVVYDSLSGRSRGFAFVYFQSVEEARAARAACARGLELHGRVVRIDYSVTKGPHDPTPGVYMGKDKRRQNRFGGWNRGGLDSRRRSSPAYAGRRSRSHTSSSPRGRRGGADMYDRFHHKMRMESSSRSRSPPPLYSPRRRTSFDPMGADPYSSVLRR